MLGHEDIKKDLSRAAGGGSLAHGYIFFGPRGVGKRLFSELLAEYLETGAWPEKPGRRALSDTLVISPDASGSIGVDAVRGIRAFLAETPFFGPRRTVIVDGAENLTTEAENALLKTAEEPPPSSLIIFIAPEVQLIPPTLASRFQKIYFGPVAAKEIERWLKEVHGAEAKHAKALAAEARGAPGLAQAFLTRDIPYEREAREFMRQRGPSFQKTFLKDLIDPETFSFSRFLDALILELARGRTVNSGLWHAVLELRRMSDVTNLNPRIQLSNLWTHI